MVIMNFLRALADLGFYYSFAGTLSAFAGGRLALAALLLQSGSFALSSALRRSRIARTAALVPSLLLFFLPVAKADLIVSTPPILYLVYLVWMDRYELSWSHYVEQFNVFWRVFFVAVWILSLMGGWRAVLSTGIPAALITVTASVLLTRSLRHEPAVYLQPGYQLINFASIILLALVALALGSEWAVRAVGFFLSSVYNTLITPLLLGVVMLIGYLFSWIVPLIRWLSCRFNPNGDEQAIENTFEEFTEDLEKMEEVFSAEPPDILNRIALAVGIIMAVAVLFLIFRWMARRHNGSETTAEPLRSNIRSPGHVAGHPNTGTYAYRIRKQYRAFLRLCRNKGLLFQISDTSTDIGEKSLDMFPNEEAMADLRDIYQQARYQGEASREDYQQFKKRLSTLKKAQATK